MNKRKKQPFYVKFGYGIGNLGYGVISQTITNFFMFFGTAVLGLSGSVIGLIISMSTLWDGISDCFVGGISDRVRLGKLGYRNGYMLIATIGMSVVNLFIWNIPLTIKCWFKYIWIAGCLILIETFNTLFATPYMALGNDISKNSNNKTLLQIYRTIAFLISIVIPSVLMVVFLPSTKEYPVGQLNPKGYGRISLVSSAICLVAGLICVFSTIKSANKVKHFRSEDKIGFKTLVVRFYSTLKNLRIRRLIFGYALAQIPSVVLTGLGLHFFTYCFLCSSKQITVLLVVLILGTICSQPVWFALSKKTSRKQSLINSIFVALLGMFVIMFVYIFRFSLLELSYFIIIFAVFVCGFGSGGLYALPISLYGDEVDKLNKLNNENMSATYLGAITLFANLASSIVLFVIGVMLDIVGFDAGLEIQPLLVQTFIAIMLFAGVVFAFIGSVIFFITYDKVKFDYKNQEKKQIE